MFSHNEMKRGIRGMKRNELWEIAMRFPHKMNWSELSCNPNITWEIIEANPEVGCLLSWDADYSSEGCDSYMCDWDWDAVSHNPNITWENVQMNPNKPWNWEYLSRSLDLATLPDLNDPRLDWDNVIMNLTLTWDMIKANMTKPLRWDYLSSHPSITWEIVQNNPDLPWDWLWLSANPNITWEIVQANTTMNWCWSTLSLIQNIEVEEINESDKWCWQWLYTNHHIRWEKYDLNKIDDESLKLIASNSSIGMDFIQSNLNSPNPRKWDLRRVSKNPNLTYEFFKNNGGDVADIAVEVNRTWDWFWVSARLPLKDIKDHEKFDYNGASINPTLTLEFILEHPEVNWDWLEISSNHFEYDENLFKKKYTLQEQEMDEILS